MHQSQRCYSKLVEMTIDASAETDHAHISASLWPDMLRHFEHAATCPWPSLAQTTKQCCNTRYTMWQRYGLIIYISILPRFRGKSKRVTLFTNLLNSVVLRATTWGTRHRCIRSRQKTVVILVRTVAHAPSPSLHAVADMLQTVEYNAILTRKHLEWSITKLIDSKCRTQG